MAVPGCAGDMTGYFSGLKIPADMPGLKSFRYRTKIISFSVRALHRFALSTADGTVKLTDLGTLW